MKWIAAALIVACTPPPPIPPSNPDAPESPFAAACAKLRDLGCPEGLPTKAGRTCAAHLAGLQELADVPAACVAAASSRDAVRACGSADTTRFRCLD